MIGARRLGVLGGTFDPIHFGHLDAAHAARAALALDEVLLVPAHDPPHKTAAPHASAFHRFALVSLAIAGDDGFRASDIELTQDGPSYTIHTLRRLHGCGWRPSQIFFIMGTDAFADIASWHEFPAVLDAAQFAVIARPNTPLEAAVGVAPEVTRRVRRPDTGVPDPPETAVFLVEARTRDVSSTTIRARLSTGRPIDDLVPPAVGRHILTHHLYRAVDHLHGENERTRG